ncbi:MAG: aminomethyltransferase family protein [Gammaproteobacteria bacterium]|nr:aminomethyltransferase family protein [Gammaproteobacteria bacterium]
MAVTRHSVLESRHRALGSPLGEWNGMDVPWEYNQDINDEHLAVRNAAGLFDVSGLKKVHVVGQDALAVINHVCTRDMSVVYPGRSTYALILNEEGCITDDCIMFHISPNHVVMVHGGGTGMEQLQKSAHDKKVTVNFDDDLHDISLQGPKSAGFLHQHTTSDIQNLRYFHHVPALLFGHQCLISRTGYSGERGYEIFAKADDIVPIWDAILDNGKTVGILPCSFNCIDAIRVEAALLFYPYDMTEENTPWEVGLGFAVSKTKAASYRGKEAVLQAEGKEKIKTFGIIAECNTAVDVGADVLQDGKKVGVITAPVFSPVIKKSIAMAQLIPDLAKPGIRVEIKGKTVLCKATTSEIPFLDPSKKKRTTLI